MQTLLFLDIFPDSLSSTLLLALALFVIAVIWSLRANKTRKNRRSRSFKERYKQRREENE